MLSLTKSLMLLESSEHRVVYTGKDGTKVTVKHTAKLSPKDFAAAGRRYPAPQKYSKPLI